MLDEDGNEVKMTESIDYGEEDLTPLIEGEDCLLYTSQRLLMISRPVKLSTVLTKQILFMYL